MTHDLLVSRTDPDVARPRWPRLTSEVLTLATVIVLVAATAALSHPLSGNAPVAPPHLPVTAPASVVVGDLDDGPGWGIRLVQVDPGCERR
ncbi:MAG TPA: hypothetical protein VEV13_05965, partial [Candidatus Limnocylindria bacterium]|nr:hypothetical protein [Candidatus Limnocylindria bacterium]